MIIQQFMGSSKSFGWVISNFEVKLFKNLWQNMEKELDG